MHDRQLHAYLIRPSGVAVPVNPAIPYTKDTPALTPFRAEYAPTVTREFKDADEMEAFLDDSWQGT